MFNFNPPHAVTQTTCKIAIHVNMATVQADSNAAVMKMMKMAPMLFQLLMRKHSSYRVIWDSGASMSISYDKSDSFGELRQPSTMLQLSGLAKGLRINAVSHVLWAIKDIDGKLHLLKVPAYYVPRYAMRLLSTSSLLQTYAREKIVLELDHLKLSGFLSDPMQGSIKAEVDPSNNLPTSWAYSYDSVSKEALAIEEAFANVVKASNRNLSDAKKELLRWHFCLGHINMQTIQSLMQSGCSFAYQSHLKPSCCSIQAA